MNFGGANGFNIKTESRHVIFLKLYLIHALIMIDGACGFTFGFFGWFWLLEFVGFHDLADEIAGQNLTHDCHLFFPLLVYALNQHFFVFNFLKLVAKPVDYFAFVFQFLFQKPYYPLELDYFLLVLSFSPFLLRQLCLQIPQFLLHLIVDVPILFCLSLHHLQLLTQKLILLFQFLIHLLLKCYLHFQGQLIRHC